MMSLSFNTVTRSKVERLSFRQSEQCGGLTPGNSVVPCGNTGEAIAQSAIAMISFLIDFSLNKLAHLGM
jgi:hypothetical protein